MTRASDGTVVPQCEAKYRTDNGHHARCTQEAGHTGEHYDARGDWRERTETLPTTEGDRRDGTVGDGDSS